MTSTTGEVSTINVRLRLHNVSILNIINTRILLANVKGGVSERCRIVSLCDVVSA
jgi:hypothetical protein